MEQFSHVSNKTMAVSSIDKSTEHNTKAWDASYCIESKPAAYVILANNRYVFRIYFIIKQLFWSKVKKNLDIDVAVDRVCEEVNCKKKANETEVPPLLQKSPAN